MLYYYVKLKASPEDVAALQEKKCIGQIQPEVYEMGEEVPVLNSMVKITTVKEMTRWQENVPEGFLILAVNYECNEAIEVEKLQELNLYLKIPDGEHVRPLSSSFLCDEIAVEYSKFYDQYECVNIMNDESGTLMYLVPQNIDCARLAIYHVPKEGSWILPGSTSTVEIYVPKDVLQNVNTENLIFNASYNGKEGSISMSELGL